MEAFLAGMVELHCGDCLEVLKTLPDNSIDSCVCDPPYHLTSIVKRFGKEGSAPVKPGVYARSTSGFMGKQWDGGDIAFRPETWIEVMRVLKPGGHLLAFSGTRTYHRMACAIEDAGFEIRDQIMWLYGSGFPKSHDVSKGIDRAAGAEREVIGQRVYADGTAGSWRKTSSNKYAQDTWTQDNSDRQKVETAPATDEALQWQGWGTALKPANEPIVLARKPLSEKTVAANVLKWGTGAINVGGCRIHSKDAPGGTYTVKRRKPGAMQNKTGGNYRPDEGPEFHGETQPGRWPANVIHDGSEEVLAEFPKTTSGNRAQGQYGGMGFHGSGEWDMPEIEGDSGSAARFFYCAKASKKDRANSKHPTVKPIKLMQYLVRLITPPGGTVLDPFAGTGTTGEAAWRENCKAVLIEREAEYQADIVTRMKSAADEPKPKSASMPLFDGI